MIALGKNKTLEFVKIGLFDTDATWIHPTVTVSTYELICVVAGSVHLFEGDETYTLEAGDSILLFPGVEHGGLSESHGRTAFYWLHFHAEDMSAWGIGKQPRLPANAEKTFREIMHSAQTDMELSEVLLARMLLETRRAGEYKSKLAYEVREYIRIHAAKNLRVEGIARLFGYSGDHLSRVYREEFGHDLKEGIVRARLLHAESLLLNTTYSIKEIAAMSGFADENLFVKFFKYHEKITPRTYRNRFFHVHMNIK
ncbi:MAG: AraC family transcriptional regulator [Ruminococcaceae bacterium]|nr:AraC family transcriptional regulator [Oscillospiraceae bacterium]